MVEAKTCHSLLWVHIPDAGFVMQEICCKKSKYFYMIYSEFLYLKSGDLVIEHVFRRTNKGHIIVLTYRLLYLIEFFHHFSLYRSQ